jgi:hypothetical protein
MESGTINSGLISNNALIYNEVEKISNNIISTLTNSDLTPTLSTMIVRVISESYVYGKNKDTQNSINTILSYLNVPIDISEIINNKLNDIIKNIQLEIKNDTALDFKVLFNSSSQSLSAVLEEPYKFLADICCILPLIQFTGNGNITMDVLVEKFTNLLVNLLTNTDGLNNLINLEIVFAPIGVNSTLWKSLGGRVDPNMVPIIVESTSTTNPAQRGGKRFSKTKKLKKKNKKTLKHI